MILLFLIVCPPSPTHHIPGSLDTCDRLLPHRVHILSLAPSLCVLRGHCTCMTLFSARTGRCTCCLEPNAELAARLVTDGHMGEVCCLLEAASNPRREAAKVWKSLFGMMPPSDAICRNSSAVARADRISIPQGRSHARSRSLLAGQLVQDNRCLAFSCREHKL